LGKTVEMVWSFAGDRMTVNNYLQLENQSEEKLDRLRGPALKVAQKLLP